MRKIELECDHCTQKILPELGVYKSKLILINMFEYADGSEAEFSRQFLDLCDNCKKAIQTVLRKDGKTEAPQGHPQRKKGVKL